jgi:hypothetical protein
MKLSAWKPAETVQRSRSFEGEQQFAQLVCHRWRYSLGVSIFVELLQPFVAKAYKLHVIPEFQYVRQHRTMSRFL